VELCRFSAKNDSACTELLKDLKPRSSIARKMDSLDYPKFKTYLSSLKKKKAGSQFNTKEGT